MYSRTIEVLNLKYMHSSLLNFDYFVYIIVPHFMTCFISRVLINHINGYKEVAKMLLLNTIWCGY
jgi:hypothetical protein